MAPCLRGLYPSRPIHSGVCNLSRHWIIFAAWIITAWSGSRGFAQNVPLPVDEDTHAESSMASSAVPLDSWIYPAFDRLTSLGYTPSTMQGMRPWTRLECARLVEEAQQAMASEENPDAEAGQIVDRLALEFFYEILLLRGSPNRSAGATNTYVRLTEIAGPPLRDSFHFAQTVGDDFGRPYGQGLNAIAGVQLHAEYGPFALLLRGEFQRAPALFAYNAEALDAIAGTDGLPAQPLPGISELTRIRPVEATVSMNLFGWQATFGEQSQWWGQSRTGSLILSNNAEAPVVLSIQRYKPVQFPWIFAYLGKIDNTFFLGQLRGQHYVRGQWPMFLLYGSAATTLNPQPFIWGDQLDLKMTPNLEFGFEITCLWAGYGRPATLHTWLHTFSSRGKSAAAGSGQAVWRISYCLPAARSSRSVSLRRRTLERRTDTHCVSHSVGHQPGALHCASSAHAAYRPSHRSSLYQYPQLSRRSGRRVLQRALRQRLSQRRTADGKLGGRSGRAVDAQATYWLSGIGRIDVSVRRQFNDRHMIGGGGLTDFSAHTFLQLHGPWQVECRVTAERWRFPILRTSAANNVTASFGIIFTPPAKGAQ